VIPVLTVRTNARPARLPSNGLLVMVKTWELVDVPIDVRDVNPLMLTSLGLLFM